MGVFEFIVMLVLIATIGEVLKAKAGRTPELPSGKEATSELEATVHDLSERLRRLEDERDFYRALLEPGGSQGTGEADRSSSPRRSPRGEQQ